MLCNEQISRVAEHIALLIDPDADCSRSMTDYQLCFALRAGLSGLLDISRQTLRETTQDVVDYAAGLSRNNATGSIHG